MQRPYGYYRPCLNGLPALKEERSTCPLYRSHPLQTERTGSGRNKNSKLDEVVVVAYAADENTATDASDTILENAEEMPKYPGGTEGLMRYLAKNIKYPVDAQKSKTQGRVVVQIIVDKEGRVTSPRIAQSVSPSLDAEAIRVVTGMPRWEPGKIKEKR